MQGVREKKVSGDFRGENVMRMESRENGKGGFGGRECRLLY